MFASNEEEEEAFCGTTLTMVNWWRTLGDPKRASSADSLLCQFWSHFLLSLPFSWPTVSTPFLDTESLTQTEVRVILAVVLLLRPHELVTLLGRARASIDLRGLRSG